MLQYFLAPDAKDLVKDKTANGQPIWKMLGVSGSPVSYTPKTPPNKGKIDPNRP